MSMDLKYAIVFVSPSRSGTLGSQPPSFSRASVMSGLRCVGSSTGTGRFTSFAAVPESSMTICASSRMVYSSGLPVLTGPRNPESLFIMRIMASIRSSTYWNERVCEPSP
eukprot:Amastigsp_a543_1313.p3 type:complete len:110 gc:universal Amastigsp_a543_1313:1043-714(-)